MTEDEYVLGIFQLQQELARTLVMLEGWKMIASEIMRVAFGDDLADLPLPPIELIELRAVGQLEAKHVAAIRQWWVDVVQRYQNARNAKADREASEVIQAGELVAIGPDGRVRKARR